MGKWAWIVLVSSCAATSSGPTSVRAQGPEDLYNSSQRIEPEDLHETAQNHQSPTLESAPDPFVARCLATNAEPGDYVIVNNVERMDIRPRLLDERSFLNCVGQYSSATQVMGIRVQSDGFGRVPRAVGALSETEVRKVIAQISFSPCVFASLKQSSPNGAALLSFEVQPDGTTRRVGLVGSHFQDPAFEDCLVATARVAMFPPRPQPTTVLFPLRFRVGNQ